MNGESNISKLRTWRIALAAVLAFAGSQLALAGHQFEHDLGSLDESCVVCIQIEQFDQATSAVPASSMPVLLPVVTSPDTELLVATASRTRYSTRAPPLL